MATPPKQVAAKARSVKVRATRTGYTNHQRYRQGDVFQYSLAAGEKLPTWVEQVDAKAAEHVTTSQEAVNEETKDLRRGDTSDPLGAAATQ